MSTKTLLPVVAAVMLGIGTVFGSQISKLEDPIAVAMYSQLLSAFFIFIFIKIKGVKINTEWRLLTKNFRKEIIQITIASFFAFTLLFLGLNLANPTKVQFLLRLEVIFVLITGFAIVKQRISFRQLSPIIIILFGSFLLTTSGNLLEFGSYLIGDLFIIVSVAFFAYIYFPTKKITQKINPVFLSCVTCLFVGLIFIPTVLLWKGFDSLIFNLSNVGYLLAYVLLASTIGYILWITSIKFNKPWFVSSLLLTQPIFGGIFAFLYLGSTLTIVQIIGAALILASSFFLIKENS